MVNIRKIAFCLGIASSLIAAKAAPTASKPAPGIEFNRDIRPILSDNCFTCHGPDDAKRKAKLRFDLKEGALRANKDGEFAIVPGDPSKSKLIDRINAKDQDDLMPPPKSGKKLSAEQKETLRRWIAAGAKWQNHWAFEKPERPALPEIKDKKWARNEIDQFVEAKLESQKLKPSTEADKTTLLRRVTFDLTGLPPTTEELDAFLADKKPKAYEKVVDRLLSSPRYGENMARYWMDASRYADSHGYHIDSERSMWKWRDWVINAFNKNLPFDQFTIDQFAGDLLTNATPEQKIASGYLRCNMTTGEGGAIVEEYQAKYMFDRTETASTMFMGLTFTCCRCHNHKYDPITQQEYYKMAAFFNNMDESIMDGNQPKPDPYMALPTPDQAKLETELKKKISDGQAKLDGPIPDVDKSQLEWTAKWHERLASNWTSLTPEVLKSTHGAALKLLDDKTIFAGGEIPDKDVHELTVKLEPGRLAALRLESLPHESLPQKGAGYTDDGRFRLSEFEAELVRYDTNGKASDPQKIKFAQTTTDSADKDADVGRAVDGKSETAWSPETNSVSKPHVAVFRLGEPLKVDANAELRLKLHFEASSNRQSLGHYRLSAARNDELVALLNPAKDATWQLIGPFPAEDNQTGYATEYPPEKEVDLKKTYPGVRDENKWQAHNDFNDGKTHTIVDELHGVHGVYYLYEKMKSTVARPIEFTIRADEIFKVWLNGKLVAERATPSEAYDGYLRVKAALREGENTFLVKMVNQVGGSSFSFNAEPDEHDPLPAHLATILAATATTSEGDQKGIQNYYRRIASPELRDLFSNVERLREQDKALSEAIPVTMIAKEMGTRRDTFILMRGEYDKKSEKVTPGVPAILPPLPSGAPTNRLGLAKWLVDPVNPLTARVNVNRLWQQFFGVGIVKTAEDFGVQGERPSHPELLDWLATEFIASGWDVKHMQRLMVTSATYRQSSHITPELYKQDPENRLLARGPRFRLDGETIRDSVLAVSGLLVEKEGGKSVKPYEPPGLWEAVSYNNAQRYVPDKGDKEYRRSLYTNWKRQSPPPNMMIFDAPTREYCVVRRPRTNTPLQALVLMNDPQFVESARAFAQRIILHGGKNDKDRIAYAFRLATARNPKPEESKVLLDILGRQLTDYAKDETSAAELLTVGDFKAKGESSDSELAAWTTIASMILNLDETVTKS
ncbi:MAG: Protein of unknown function (DUF1553)/Protein of unknown function (DUF1549)/Planctomycete [Verrucomicrobiales bacterium]|nr:Protein of unknown function (DUF1553)/Protein of unknown function (DUF1549)/Planctomycete [Verrucomicrobiales bacterium]